MEGKGVQYTSPIYNQQKYQHRENINSYNLYISTKWNDITIIPNVTTRRFTRVLMSPQPDQVKETSSEACQVRPRFQQNQDASCHQVSFPARQGAEGNSRHSERNISMFPTWSG